LGTEKGKGESVWERHERIIKGLIEAGEIITKQSKVKMSSFALSARRKQNPRNDRRFTKEAVARQTIIIP